MRILGPRSALRLLTALGALATPAFVGAQDIPWSTGWAALPAPAEHSPSPRESHIACPMPPGAPARVLGIQLYAHGHGGEEADGVQGQLAVMNQPLFNALKIDPYIRMQVVCSASPDLLTDCETHTSEWLHLTTLKAEWPEEECTESHPYLVGARCATSNGLSVGSPEADADTAELHDPSASESTEEPSDHGDPEQNMCDLTTFSPTTSATPAEPPPVEADDAE